MRSRSLIQPYFILSLALIILGWVGLTPTHGLDDITLAIGTFVLSVTASLSVFVMWRLFSTDRAVLWGSFVAFVILAPIAWVSMHFAILYAYAYVVNQCCENSRLLQITIWRGLTRLTENDMVPVVYSGLMVYVSAWLLLNVGQSAKRAVFLKMTTITALFIFIVSLAIAVSA